MNHNKNNIDSNNVPQNNDRPAATIIMPVYNSPDLFRALDSVRRQTYRPIQFIIVDDASASFEKDGVQEYLSNAGDGFRFHILRNPKNAGTVRTINRGLALAEGKYVFNLSADDAFYDENVISDWVQAFEQTECDVLTAKRANCDKELNKICSFSPSSKDIQAIETLSSKELFEYLVKDNPISGACTAWCTDSLRRLSLYDERYRLIEDYPAFLKLLREGGKIAFFDRPVILYRGGGMSEEERSYSHDYIRDYVLTVNTEIIPYTRHKFSARARLYRWKQRVAFDRWFNDTLDKKQDCPLIILILRLLYCIYHPVRQYRRLLRKKAGTDTE